MIYVRTLIRLWSDAWPVKTNKDVTSAETMCTLSLTMWWAPENGGPRASIQKRHISRTFYHKKYVCSTNTSLLFRLYFADIQQIVNT